MTKAVSILGIRVHEHTHTHTRGTPNSDNASGQGCCYTTKKKINRFLLFWVFFSMIPIGYP